MVKQVEVVVKVNEELKSKMKRLKINWSEAIRRFINLEIEKQKNTALALSIMHRLSNEIKLGKDTDTTTTIRKLRDERH